MSTPTYDEVRQSYQDSYAQASSQYNPYVLPYNTLGYTILIVYLQFSCYAAVRRYKYVVVCTIWALSLHMLLYSRTLSFAYGLFVGPNVIWAAVLACTLVVFGEPHRDYKRLVRKEHDVGIPLLSRLLNRFNGPEPGQSNGAATNGKTSSSSPHKPTTSEGFEWQSMPADFWRRLIWVHDLILSFRGPHWIRQAPSSTPPPPLKLLKPPSLTTSLLRFSTLYLTIDLLKTLMLSDPYFLSLGAHTIPSWLPSPHGLTDYLLIRTARSILSYTGIYCGLNLQFETTNLISYHVLPLGTILGDSSVPELHETLFGPVRSVLDNGLIGFWSRYWHGLLRFSFVSAGTWIAKQLGYAERSRQAKVTVVLVAFVISGYGHGAAAYTLWGNRERAVVQAMKAFSFFAVQPVGIVLQVLLLPQAVAAQGEKGEMKVPLSSRRKVMNVLFVMAWLWLTCPLLNDPLADGGNWLVEPLPISFLRGLGFSRDKRWLCWTSIPVRLVWDRERWWLSGLQIL